MSTAIIGYAHASTYGQILDAQLELLLRLCAGVDG